MTIPFELNTTHCMDCLEALKLLPDKCVDLVLTDPPYGTHNLSGGYGRKQLWGKTGRNHCIENDEDLSILKEAFPHFLRIVKNGWVMAFFTSRKTPDFISTTSSGDWFGTIIWDKLMPGLGFHIRYAHENIAVFKVGEPERPLKPIQSIIRCCSNPIIHPHQKPLELLHPLITWGCPHDGIVLDAFAGVGSTCVASLQTGRRFIGMEISPEYTKLANDRCEAARKGLTLNEHRNGQQSLFGE